MFPHGKWQLTSTGVKRSSVASASIISVVTKQFSSFWGGVWGQTDNHMKASIFSSSLPSPLPPLFSRHLLGFFKPASLPLSPPVSFPFSASAW